MEHVAFSASAIVRAFAFTFITLGFAFAASRFYFAYKALRVGWRRTHRWFGVTRNGLIVRSERLVSDDSIGGYSPCGCYETVTLPYSPIASCQRVAGERCGVHAPKRMRA